MDDKAQLFFTGNDQVVCLPDAYRFEGHEVFIRRDARTGDVILSRWPSSWDSFFALYATTEVPADFMSPADRGQEPPPDDPFAGSGK